jgi:hypothetical protein
MTPIDVAHRHDVAETIMVVRIAHPHAAGANAANPRPVVLRLIGKRLTSPREEWGRRNRGARLDELSTV